MSRSESLTTDPARFHRLFCGFSSIHHPSDGPQVHRIHQLVAPPSTTITLPVM